MPTDSQTKFFRLLSSEGDDVVAAFAVYVRGIIGLPACKHAAALCFHGRAWLIASRKEKASALRERFLDAGSRGRTDTRFKSNGILSPARLPIPPCRQSAELTLVDPRGLEPRTDRL